MKRNKNEKGVTLISLVVAIIVLLIISAISIAVLTGDSGLINNANGAKEQAIIDKEKEKLQISVANAINDDELGYLLENNLENALTQNIGNKDVDYTLTSSNNKFKIKYLSSGHEYVVDGDGNIIIPKWKANGDNTFTDTDGTTVKIGDYVNYDCNTGVTNTSYISPSTKNGYGDQKFMLEDYKQGKWQVLGVGDNGGLMLISSDIIGPKTGGYVSGNETYFYLKKKDGYVNGETELDKISDLYGHGQYAESARSINVEDINNITGYVDNVYKKEANNIDKTGNEVTYKNVNGFIYCKGTQYPTSDNHGTLIWEDDTNGVKTTISSFTYWTGSTWKSLSNGESATLKHNYYYYYPTTLTTREVDPVRGIESSSKEYLLLFDNTTVKQYWLGSQCFSAGEGTGGFGIRSVNNGYVQMGSLYFADNYYNSVYSGIRPAVSLETNVKLTSGSGTDTDPWILGE